MKTVFSKLFRKPTLVLVVATLAMGAGSTIAILELNSGKPESGMAAGIILAAVFIAIVCLVADRILVRFIKPLPLSIIELILIVSIRLYFLYEDRALYVNLKTTNEIILY